LSGLRVGRIKIGEHIRCLVGVAVRLRRGALAAFDPVCPQAGGVGLGDLVQHLFMFDFVAVSEPMDDRVIEYVDAFPDSVVWAREPQRSAA
jgi:hypothetical protein